MKSVYLNFFLLISARVAINLTVPLKIDMSNKKKNASEKEDG